VANGFHDGKFLPTTLGLVEQGEAAMLTVWGRTTSSNVQALMWCIGELGLPFSRRDIGHKYGGQDTPEFLAINPNGTVPVLKDGDGEPL
jgi:glutathione S-transferase